MTREFTCIICPNGCEIAATIENNIVVKTKGSLCKKGEEYVVQEITAPKRTISSSIKVIGGDITLVSVRLSDCIPKEKIFVVMDEIKKVEVEAPTHIGQIIIENIQSRTLCLFHRFYIIKIHFKRFPFFHKYMT